MKKKITSLMLTAAVATSAFMACGTTNNEAVGEASDNIAAASNLEATEGFPITMEHAYGQTVIESKPERVVTLGWGNQDTMLALGIVPVGVSAANYGAVTEDKLHLWTKDAFTELGVDSPNVFNDETSWDFEAIAVAEPDAIVASYSGFSEDEYNQLSEIAPTVPFAEIAWKTTWREQMITNATAVGMKEKGEELVAETDKLIADKLAEYPDLDGKTAGFFWVSQDDMSTFYAYLPADPRAAYLNDLGLATPDSIHKLGEDTEEFSVTISRENADILSDVDIMVCYGDEGLLEAMQADPLMSQIPAVKNGAVVLLDSTSVLAAATTPSILSIPYAIDDYLTVLNEAASKVNE
ncbi:iron complex transport system substrate-binding protein [Pseudobutyrivibrio sp. ACV-2]|uniref:iron-siderophore ABC transporter substrate-binding protein n=1 Tax=Pseudobutyrivibrio sp. ACV-2 TaxID=1520801 RepID=UPI0008961151|nr:iron-siderophore ABC transporter substrate-binding protein [Pseudobutyrivibrio sp. ACV-2]SDZ89478.1 iron complex transport system substrate-binding protein [Pseudobutyrivibrio sp. ACV-2]